MRGTLMQFNNQGELTNCDLAIRYTFPDYDPNFNADGEQN